MTPDFDRHELIPAVVQDRATLQVRMVGYMNREAYERTCATGQLHFWSRSRAELWRKGETSGHVHAVRALSVDCDGDAILVTAEPSGPTCHLGHDSCFAVRAWGEGAPAPVAELQRLEAVVRQRLRDRPPGSYTAELAAAGPARMAQKVGEEAVETLIAALAGDDAALVNEAADLLYHLVVLLAARGVAVADVMAALARRGGAPA